MRGHLSAEGAEQTGSQSYVPPAEKDDKALGAAYKLLRGVTVNAECRLRRLHFRTECRLRNLPALALAGDGRAADRLRGARRTVA